VPVSAAPILVRVAHVPALALGFWRCLAGALLLAPWALRSSRVRRPLGWSQWRWLLASGACLALHFALFNASLALTTVASSAVLVNTSPLFVGLGGRLIGEPPSRRVWAGIVLAVAGAVVVGSGDAASISLGPRALLGDLMAFGGAVAFSGYLMLGRVLRRNLEAPTYNTAVFGTAALVLLPACLLTGARLGGYSAHSWLAVAGVIAGPQLLGHTVLNLLLSTVTAAVIAVVVLSEPVGATLLAWWLFGELPALTFWAGAPLVLAGVWLSTTSSRQARQAPID
jgi:drug/metabolite transporter (DMT)-like permease